MQETLMPLRPKTDKDLLVWEKAKSKDLEEKLEASQIKNGELQSELDELKHRMKKEQVGALILKNNRLAKKGNEKDQKIRSLKKTNADLLASLVRLQSTGSINNEVKEESSQDN